MRKLLILALLLIHPLSATYNYRRSITINSSMITGTLSNWPMAIQSSLTDLKTVANGGQVQNSNGYDIIFTSDSAGVTVLACEQEAYTATTGSIYYWVNLPSATVGTVIYLWYGNSAISTAQCTGSGVWDANESMVLHMGNGSTLSAADSTGNNTVTNNSATAQASCIVDGCGNFNGSSAYLSAPNSSSLLLGTAMTFETWFNIQGGPTSPCFNVATCFQEFIDKRNTSGSGHGYLFGYERNTAQSPFPVDGLEFYVSGSTTNCDLYAPNLSLRGSWFHAAATYDGTTMKMYLNGSPISLLVGVGGCSSATVSSGSTNDSSAPLNVAKLVNLNSGSFQYVNGYLDEMRISNSVRTAAWIAADYTNQSNPPAFYTIGSAVAVGSTVNVFPIIFD